jgi:predicted ferric reductase
MVSITLIVVLVLIVAIWLIIEFKRFRHKLLAIFLILLVLFTYFSFSTILNKNSLDLKTVDGVKEAGKLYVIWLGNVFKNVGAITADAIHLNWGINESLKDIDNNMTIRESLKLNNSKS